MAFRFKHFTLYQDLCAMKVGTDGVLLGAWARGGQHVLDVGTGTGLIALMMAQRFPDSVITAVDIDEGAVLQARQNVESVHCEERILVSRCSVQDMGRKPSYHGTFNAIVSNPPFFIGSLRAPDPQRSMARHAETLPYGDLMEAAWYLLSDDGELSVVVPFDYCQRMEDEATFRGFFLSRMCAVSTVEGKKAKRYLLAFRKHPCQCQREQMTIGDDYYRTLTQDFYL